MSVLARHRPPTQRQAAILEWMKNYFIAHQIQPSIRDICEAFSIKSPNGAMCHLHALKERGYLEWTDSTARSFRFVGYRVVLEPIVEDQA